MRTALSLACLAVLSGAAHADGACADIHAKPAADDPPPIAAATRLPAGHDLKLSDDWRVGDPIGTSRVRMPWGTLVLVPVVWGGNGAGIVFVRERAGVRCVLGSWSFVFGGNGVTLDAVRVLAAASPARRRVEIKAAGQFHHYYEVCTDEADGGDDVEDCHDSQRYVGGQQPVNALVEIDRSSVRVISDDR